MRFLVLPLLLSVGGCALLGQTSPAPLSLEFGQDAYLTDTYLQETPGSQCGLPPYALRGTEVRAPLPDGSWFRLFALPSSEGEVGTVVLQRGWESREAQMEIRLDDEEGIVRLRDRGQERAWGFFSSRAEWMRAIGSRALSLDCVSIG